MQIKITDFDFSDKKLFQKALQIRTIVFVQEQKVPKNLEYDGLDGQAKHFLLFFNDKPIATSRYRITNEGYKLERFAVLKEYRGKHFGKKLLEYILNYVPDKTNVYFNSQVSAVDFYERNGFVTVGQVFYEADIKHYKMVWQEKKIL